MGKLSFDNIEKHPTKVGGYIGYTAQGFARHIEKSNYNHGFWVAYPNPDEDIMADCLYAKTLSAMSVLLHTCLSTPVLGATHG